MLNQTACHLSSELLAALASSCAPLDVEIDRLRLEPKLPFRAEIEELLRALPSADVEKTETDAKFLWFWKESSPDVRHYRARLALLTHRVGTRIAALRLGYLCGRYSLTDLPLPDVRPLLALPADSEGLVSLNHFTLRGGYLAADGHLFSPAIPVQSPNAMYWFTLALERLPPDSEARVRVDPFLWGPAETFRAGFYKMWIYGRPLDWKRIATLSEEEHGSWQPGPLTSPSVRRTEFVWSPRGSEVHFECEEVPVLEEMKTRGTRYIHAVFDKRSELVTHFDCAIRTLDEERWADRDSSHLRKLSKIGTRAKLCRVDGALSGDLFSTLCATYFVWNQDVTYYFASASRS